MSTLIHDALETAESQHAMFGSGSRLLMNGGSASFQQHTHLHRVHNLDGVSLLYQNSSTGAAHNSKERYDPPKCHPNTRGGLLNMTRDWDNRGPPRIMWLYGSAGAGKSAVAQTMSEELRAESNLAASFFFSRTASVDSHRGHEGRFVTTIAYQLFQSIPDLRSYMSRVIENDQSVFDLTLGEQVSALIIGPMEQLKHENTDEGAPRKFPRIIIVDGLDEYQEESGQEQVLEAIATLAGRDSDNDSPFSIFLSSRPEVVIRSWFSTIHATYPSLMLSVSLLDEYDSDHDIKIVVEAEAAKIKQTHPFKSPYS